jgi:hypothetical protein
MKVVKYFAVADLEVSAREVLGLVVEDLLGVVLSLQHCSHFQVDQVMVHALQVEYLPLYVG